MLKPCDLYSKFQGIHLNILHSYFNYNNTSIITDDYNIIINHYDEKLLIITNEVHAPSLAIQTHNQLIRILFHASLQKVYFFKAFVDHITK